MGSDVLPDDFSRAPGATWASTDHPRLSNCWPQMPHPSTKRQCFPRLSLLPQAVVEQLVDLWPMGSPNIESPEITWTIRPMLQVETTTEFGPTQMNMHRAVTTNLLEGFTLQGISHRNTNPCQNRSPKKISTSWSANSLDISGPLGHWDFPTSTRQAWALRSVQSGRKKL